MSDIFERLKLRRLTNVSGTETPFGGAPAAPEVLAAVGDLTRHSVYMSELQAAASDVIARATGAEAGYVTGCTAASIAISVAASMTGTDLALAERLPDVTGLKDEVVMQHGHEVTYGQIVSQNIRLTGARVVKIGAATQCSAYQLRDALTPRTTAAFFVVSPLTVQERLITLKAFCDVCHAQGVPVIVDAASQPDARPYLAAGGDLVLLSGQKALEGLTAGIIAGRMELVRACMYQMHGIGRPMKAGKEGVIGVIAALERWMRRDAVGIQASVAARTERARERLARMVGLNTRIVGQQLVLAIDPTKAGLTAHQVSVALARQSPSIVVWDQFAAIGELRLTFRLVDDDVAEHVCDRIEAVLRDVAQFSTLDREPPNLGDNILIQLSKWPESSSDQVPIAADVT
jgi:uncharacterized pyridoxal phosphate-dependent enzyme